MVHRHERTELIESMHAEAQSNLPILQDDFAGAYTFLSWTQTVIDQLQQAAPAAGNKDGIIAVTPAC